jgi:hypothetical protein
MIAAKEIRKTSKGNTYMILQDSPSTFHVSVSIGNYVIYDFINTASNVEEIYQRGEKLETELQEKIDINQI